MARKIAVTLNGKLVKVDGKILTIETDDEFSVGTSDSYDITSDLEIPTTKAVSKIVKELSNTLTIAGNSDFYYYLTLSDGVTKNITDFFAYFTNDRIPTYEELVNLDIDKIKFKSLAIDCYSNCGMKEFDELIFYKNGRSINSSTDNCGLMFSATMFSHLIWLLIDADNNWFMRVNCDYINSSSDY